MTFVAVSPEATYTTSYFDRRNGQEVTNESRMVLAQVFKKSNAVEGDMLETSLAPAILVKYVVGSGFTPNPTLQTLYVDVTGRVLNNVKSYRTNKSTTTEVAVLSAEALKSLKAKVAAVPADAKLIDLQDGQPMCTDAPSASVIASVKNQDVTVYQRSGCHDFAVESSVATELKEIMLGLANLAN